MITPQQQSDLSVNCQLLSTQFHGKLGKRAGVAIHVHCPQFRPLLPMMQPHFSVESAPLPLGLQ